MAHIASVKIETGMMLLDVLIETSGGTDPILCHGHRKAGRGRMKTSSSSTRPTTTGGADVQQPLPAEPPDRPIT